MKTTYDLRHSYTILKFRKSHNLLLMLTVGTYRYYRH